MTEQARKDIKQILKLMEQIPGGTTLTPGSLVEELHPEISYDELFEGYMYDFNSILFKEAEKRGMYIDDARHDDLCEGNPPRYDFVLYHKNPGKECPHCGHADTTEIKYAMPQCSLVQLNDDRTNHRIALSTDFNFEGHPDYYCFTCGRPFGNAPKRYTADWIQEIRFGLGKFQDIYELVSFKLTGGKCIIEISSELFRQHETKTMTIEKWQKFISDFTREVFLPDCSSKEPESKIHSRYWEIEIIFSNGSEILYSGENRYPPYWAVLHHWIYRYTR